MSSSLVLSVNTNTEDTTTDPSFFSCPLCCEDKPLSHLCILTKCSHESCRECCVKWIEKAEAGGQHGLPACPWCRVEMTPAETMHYLGRPFAPATPTADRTLLEELDDLTLQWLQESTRQCPNCNAYIEKIRGGCDLMECLCGFRFCYGCGSHSAQCSCTPSHHYFWDNVLDRAAARAAPPRASLDDDGKIDLRHHIEARLHKERAEKTKMERRNRKQQNANEIYGMDIPTSSAIWLFSNNPSHVLNQVVQTQTIRTQRSRRRYEVSREVQRDSNNNQNTILYGAKWLFDCKGSGLKWLNYITASSQITMTKRARNRRDICLKRELPVYSAEWLFAYNCNTKEQGFQILNQQTSSSATTTKRLRMTRKSELTKFDGAQLAIVNGSWLYQRRTPRKTQQQLTRLYQQSRPTFLRQGLRHFFGSSNSYNCYGNSTNRLAEQMERENALHIRLLFLSPQEQEKEKEELFTMAKKKVSVSSPFHNPFLPSIPSPFDDWGNMGGCGFGFGFDPFDDL